MATAAKDMWVANLIEPWKGDQSSVPVHEFFEAIDEAAEMGRLSAKDKVRLARLKLRGVAKSFYSTQPELKGDDIEYVDFKTAFVQRFKEKQTDQYNYTRLQNASQEKDESPEMYLDRLRKLCQRTVQHTGNPVEQAILNREAEKRLLAAFISGLRGIPGKHVRLQMPDTIDKALNMAIVATNVETSERDGNRNERASKQNVFAVRGDRGKFQGPSVWNPRSKSQEGNYRVGSGFTSTGQYPRGRGAWKGTRSFRTESRTSVRDGAAPGMGVGLYRGTSAGGGAAPAIVRAGSRTFAGEGSASGPKNDDDRYARCDLNGPQCYNCGLYGHFRRECRRGREGCPGSRRNHPNGIGKAN
jgi:hypothetical protein